MNFEKTEFKVNELKLEIKKLQIWIRENPTQADHLDFGQLKAMQDHLGYLECRYAREKLKKEEGESNGG